MTGVQTCALPILQDPFFRKALNLAVDGTDMQELRAMMELEIALDQHSAEAEAKVFENAGGYAPTVGIIGAVLGLIQVMKNLANIDEVGHGIAVSFVATVYGVGAANLLFLPSATKIKSRAQVETQRQDRRARQGSGRIRSASPRQPFHSCPCRFERCRPLALCVLSVITTIGELSERPG